MKSIMPYYNALRRIFLEILFPSLCLCCAGPAPDSDELICEGCFRRILIVGVTHKLSASIRLAHIGLYEDQNLRQIIRGLKYEKKVGVMEILDRLILRYLSLNPAAQGMKADLILPIPLHAGRERQRGFNQAELIAEGLAKAIDTPVLKGRLKRIKKTRPQIEMKNDEERKRNVENCFALEKPETLAGKSIILVDDVYTSGATMKEAIRVLRKAGVRKITIFVLAKA